jgi:hypothetical protein
MGLALAVSSFTAVRAEHVKPNKSKTYNCSSGTACVTANASGSAGNALYGNSTVGTGVLGQTSAANNSAVVGNATGNGNGVYAQSADSSGGYWALRAIGLNAATNLLDAANHANNAACHIDPNANLSCTGTVTGGADVRVRHITSAHQHVLTYAAESASATIDDVGTARMTGGVANVTIDRAFASTIDRNSAYHVFLTPMADTRGLYVSMKTAAGFQVREAQGGRSNLLFDYRIVARPFDAKSDRLPIVPPMDGR